VVRLLVAFALVGTLRRDARRAARQGTRLEAASEQMGAMRERLKESYPDSARVRERVRRWTRFLARRRADVDFATTQGLDWRGGAVLGWSGMRGVVTLAAAQTLPDRKSTRLNSSHVSISYAVFCLKKKKDDFYIEYRSG